jgi:hypothetical protein
MNATEYTMSLLKSTGEKWLTDCGGKMKVKNTTYSEKAMFRVNNSRISIVFLIPILWILFFSHVAVGNDLKLALMPSYGQSTTYANAVVGSPISVWGRVWGGSENYSFYFDLGDGSYYPPLDSNENPTYQNVTDKHYIGIEHTFSGGGLKTVTLTVKDSVGTTVSIQCRINVIVGPTFDQRVNMAIEKGLIWIYRNQIRYDDNRVYWRDTGGTFGLAATAASLMAFEENGHLPKNNYEDDIYAETVQKGLNYIVTYSAARTFELGDSSHHSDGIDIRDSDSNGDDLGAYFYSGYDGGYSTAFAALPLVLAHKTATDAKGDPISSGPFSGWSYYKLVRNIMDQYSYCQGDGGTNRGGWRYYMTYPSNTPPDGSAQQWPNLLFKAAKDLWDLSPQQWVLDNSVYSYKYLQGSDGGCGYRSPGDITNIAKTGGMLVGYSVGGKAVGDADLAVDTGIAYIGSKWFDPEEGSWGIGWAGDFYASAPSAAWCFL